MRTGVSCMVFKFVLQNVNRWERWKKKQRMLGDTTPLASGYDKG